MKRTTVPKNERELTALDKVLRVIFWNPESEFSLSELALKAGVSKSTASRLLESLKKNRIVKVDDKGMVLRIKANIDCPEFVKMKIVYNLKIVFDSGLVDFLNEKLAYPKAIVLIGSFRKGEDISTSDIDIAVETGKAADTETVHIDGIEQYEKIFQGRKVQVILFNRKSVDLNLFNSIVNGIVLSGFMEAKP